MRIELEVKEYFNELIRIESVYSQEEALYPWIFILLKIAEIRKSDKLKERYSKIDIINVPGARNGERLLDEAASIREQLTEFVGTPDIALISGNKVLGCVEAKNILPYKLFANDYEVPDTIDFPTILKKKNINKDQIITKGKNKGEEKPPLFLWRYEDAGIINLQDVNEYAPHQLLSHLQKFNKVIYTNGLEFYYLRLLQEETGKVIKIMKLANLFDSYDEYKKTPEDPKIIIKAKEEWDALLDNLSEIDWFNIDANLNFGVPQFMIQDEKGIIINKIGEER